MFLKKFPEFQDIAMYNTRPNRPVVTTPERAVIGSLPREQS